MFEMDSTSLLPFFYLFIEGLHSGDPIPVVASSLFFVDLFQQLGMIRGPFFVFSWE